MSISHSSNLDYLNGLKQILEEDDTQDNEKMLYKALILDLLQK